MIDYIYDQPKCLERILTEREKFCIPLVEFINKHNIKRVYITGSGTSYHASLLMKMYFDKFTNFETSVSIPTQFSKHEVFSKNFSVEESLLLAISQSGTSSSSIEALQKGNKIGFHTLAITEDLTSLITQEADLTLHLNCGKELIPIETRGYTATVLFALVCAVSIGHAQGSLSGPRYQEMLQEIRQNISEMPKVFRNIESWYEQNKFELISMEKGAISGYGYNYVTALEAYLKLYETFHKPLSAHQFDELLHGYEMAFDCKQTVFFIVSAGEEVKELPLYQNFLNNLTTHQFVITNQSIPINTQDLQLGIQVSNEFSPILFVLPFQILAARNCEAIGYDTSVYPHNERSFSHIR